MKLNLVLLPLLQHVLCAQQDVDPAELQSALRSKHVDAWIDGVAAKRQISKDAVRSNVRAVTHHLDPVTKHHGSGGGRHAKLEPRQAHPRGYPAVYGAEDRNNRLTNNRLTDYHVQCLSNYDDPKGSPFTPEYGKSFWRGAGGACGRGNTVITYCKLPHRFAPPGWDPNARRNMRMLSKNCATGYVCSRFSAYSFAHDRPVSWAGCVEEVRTDKNETLYHVPDFYGMYFCPISSKTVHQWDMYAESTDGYGVTWQVFTGYPHDPLYTSRDAVTFLFGTTVTWNGTEPGDRPWLKYERKWSAASIRLYSHVI